MDNLVKRAQRKDADAADAISDTILICWEKLEQLRQAEFFKTWMTRILINQCNNILKQRKKVVPVDEIREAAESSQEYENIEWMETLQSLDEKYRLIIVLYYVNGLSTTEIGTILHMPVSTVRTRLSRGRNQMASLYGVKTGREH